jgi:hypothetical protein
MDDRQGKDTRQFRQRLDDALRTRDPETVRAFLVAAGQWDDDAAGDVEAYMWMMIAGSPALKDLHDSAQQWLRSHGHAAEADLIGGARSRASQPNSDARQPQSRHIGAHGAPRHDGNRRPHGRPGPRGNRPGP